VGTAATGTFTVVPDHIATGSDPVDVNEIYIWYHEFCVPPGVAGIN